jgi:hypothetical protein
MSSPTKDYSTISPSARSLLWMKALTDIPFVRSAAGLIFGEETLPHDQHELVTAQFLKRLAHFETRYWSIDAALSMLGISNILEIASGFSFRGLHKTLYEDAYYIDTDLPEMIETKETLVRRLMRKLPDAPIGQMLLKPLNALDEDALKALVYWYTWMKEKSENSVRTSGNNSCKEVGIGSVQTYISGTRKRTCQD